MAAKIAKYIGFSVFGLLIVAVGALFFVNDKAIETSSGPLASPALSLKHGILSAFDSAAGTSDQARDSRVPRVVQELPPAPAPEAIATPVQTRSLSDIASETQQQYAQRDAADGAVIENNQMSASTNEMTAQGQPAAAAEQSNTLAADTPPPPPTMAAPNDASPAESEILGNANTALPVDSAPPAAASEPDPAEMALLESLEQQPSDDVAGLPTETPEETERLESATDEDLDPSGERAYAEGLRYYSGDGVERNFGTAALHFMKAAERGHADAQYSLGLMNYVGQTGGQDFSNAAKWFQMAAESGHIQAQYNLGFLYYEGKGVQQDLKTAYGWIDRAAQQGYAKAVKARDALQKAMPEMFGS